MTKKRPVLVGAPRSPSRNSNRVVAMAIAGDDPGYIGTATLTFIRGDDIDDLVDCHACLRLIKVAHS